MTCTFTLCDICQVVVNYLVTGKSCVAAIGTRLQRGAECETRDVLVYVCVKYISFVQKYSGTILPLSK